MKKYALLPKSVRIVANACVILCILSPLALFFKYVRTLFLSDFPNPFFIAVVLLFLSSIICINQAYQEGGNSYLNQSRAWRVRKGMEDSYDYFGAKPIYVSFTNNLIYCSVLLVCILLFLYHFDFIDVYFITNKLFGSSY